MKKIASTLETNKLLKISLLFVITLLFSVNTTFSQSLIEKLGGIKTDFTFMSFDKKVPVLAQAIIKRGYYNNGGTTDAKYGYGLQSFHLEFTTNHNFEKKRIWASYEIKLIDDNDKVLSITKIDAEYIRIVSNKDDLYTYSINLYSIPILLLDKTKKINIE